MRLTKAATAVAGIMTTTMLAVLPLTGTAAATSTTATVGVPTSAAAPIDWKRCSDPGLRQAGARCGFLTVPLDHADPDGPTIKLAVSRVLHTREPYRGVVLTNPGGPGASGTYVATFGSYVPGKVAQTYDWYGVDPRGVGASRPALSCDEDYFGWDRKPYVPRTSGIMKYWRERAEGYAQDCGTAAAAELLPYLRTIDNVADFEVLRESVGASRITFYGFSYGTYLAQVYATLHPDRVQALVLDGVVDPEKVWYEANLDQDRAFDYSFDQFLRWVSRHDRAYDLGGTPRAVRLSYEALRTRLTRRPADGKVGPDELGDVLLLAAYYRGYYDLVAGAWSVLAHHGDATMVKQLYRSSNPVGPKADNGYAMYLATVCTDAPWPEEWSTWRQDTWQVHEEAPFLTWANTWFNAPCLDWPAPSSMPVEVDGSTLEAPVLLLSETHDPATPYAGALRVRQLFPSSALVAGVGGTSHAVSLSGIACTDETVADLLRNGSLPARRYGDRADKRCRPLPAPQPSTRPTHERPLLVAQRPQTSSPRLLLR